jgi:2-oxoglutarate dehydrogenase E2 component (dihydrolipoamide succinyltransferase)
MTTNVVVPEMGESIVEARVARWLKQVGDRVSVGEAVVELETEKVNFEVGVERAGVLTRIDRKEGEDLKTGDVLGVIDEAPAEAATAPPPKTAAVAQQAAAPVPAAATPQSAAAAQPAATAQPDGGSGREKATPVARRLAEEHHIDLSGVTGTGPGGRVTKQDIEALVQQREAGSPVGPAPPHPPSDHPREEERVRMSLRRKTIARRLVEAQHAAAMLTTFNEVDMSAVMSLRQRTKESFQARHGVTLGIVSFFVKAAIGALQDFPRFNAEVQDDEMIIKHYYDIGVAIGADEGLVVPVLRDADRMSFVEIEKSIKGYAQKAEEGTLSLEDLRGGTFTITNGGVFGSLLSTPILNPPQVAILGLHRIGDRPVAIGGQVVVRPMMYVALSYDHRIVDGREAVLFLVRVKELVEDPERLLLVD